MHERPFKESPYFHIGRADELSGTDRILYRCFEILPGFLSWGTLITLVLLAFFAPTIAAYFTLGFAIYWLLRALYLSAHLRYNWRRIEHNLRADWTERLSVMRHEHIKHLVILPFYKEPRETIEATLAGIRDADGDSQKILIVLAAEERAGKEAQVLAEEMRANYADSFGGFLVTTHPDGVPGELAGKGSNISHAAAVARTELLDARGIPYEDVIVSAFDIDTVPYPQYFQCLTWHFLSEEEPHKRSFQPVPFYNNNIWRAPALSRVVAASSTFWQMIQQERPEKLATFSSHAISFKALYEANYWQRNVVSEDSRIYWNLLVANDGDYAVVPIAYPVSMDANVSRNLLVTSANIYRQHRRWMWGVENIPYILFMFAKNKRIPLKVKLSRSFAQIEGFWSLATNPLILFVLGWLPLFVGGRAFHTTILSYNLPIVARTALTLAMAGLIISAIISLRILPPRPDGKRWHHYVYMTLQWVLVPITMPLFGSVPGLDAQTRLMFGRYMGFWVTPKDRTERA